MTTARFDLDAYLRRIGHAGPVAPDLPTLRALCAAQPACIAFENLDPFIGRVPDLAPAALHDKLLAQRRGGYCYELNALLRDALQAIGFQVTGLAARVLWGTPPETPLRARSHMLLRVDLPGHGPFLVDGGFGGWLLDAPLPLAAGRVHERATGRVRLVGVGAEVLFEAETPEGWKSAYRFGFDGHQPVDYEPLNWFTATRPGSLFANHLLIERLMPQQRASLFDDRLTLQAHGQQPQVRHLEDASDLACVLDEVFDLVPPVPAAELFARLPRTDQAPASP